MATFASNLRSVLLSASDGTSLQKLSRQSVLFKQQQNAIGIFYMESGLAKLTRAGPDGRGLIISVAGPAQVVGEECLLRAAAAHASTSVCLTDVTGYHIPLTGLKRLLGVPEFSAGLISYLLARNAEMSHKVEMLALRDVEHRILHGLAVLASLVKPSSDGSAFPIPMTQAEIASYVGATRETTSTTLSILQNRRLLTLGRRLVTTVHPETLIAAANDRIASASGTKIQARSAHF